mmetsp:Transcript_5827/g.14296  ORF Transcript_5827/g.14296 Transcript_5827/m.14296 type:complete len:368 (-) Transcript_5827:343-1446(-)
MSKGGASLSSLRADCEAQGLSAEAVFGDSRLFNQNSAVITWQRLPEFQQLSLTLIAQQLLHSTPLYKDLTAPPELYLPGQLSSQNLILRQHAVVFVSALNAKATFVVNELLDKYNFEKKLTITTDPHNFQRRRRSSALPPLQRDFPFKLRRTSQLMESRLPGPRRKPIITFCPSSRKAVIAIRRLPALKAEAGAPKPTIPWTASSDRSSRTSRRSSISGAISRARSRHLQNIRTVDREKDPYPFTITHMLLYLDSTTFEGNVGQQLADEVRQARFKGIEMILTHELDEERDGCPFSRLLEATPDDLVHDGLYQKRPIAFEAEPYRDISLALLAKALGAIKSNVFKPSLRMTNCRSTFSEAAELVLGA